VATELVIVRVLRLVDLLPRGRDVLLCSAKIAVPVSDVYCRSLCEDRSTATQDQTKGRSDKHIFLNHHDD
jgi:hypothetical protein